MQKFGILLFLVAALTACHSGKKKDKNVKVTKSAFFDSFSKLHLPYYVSDTAMGQHVDSGGISRQDLELILPDSVVQKITNGNNALHAVGRIDADSNRYLLLSADRNKNFRWYALAFTTDNKFLSYIEVLNNRHENNYNYKLTINQEPTFISGRNKKGEHAHALYTNQGYAYSQSAKRFTLVINDTNEDLPEQGEIYNPIDTLPARYAFSGDYKEDKKNFLALRDGKRPSEYNFFLHFDKTDEDPACKGELKGTLKMVSDKSGIYQQGGDPCVINFTLGKNRVAIKEQGNCANHRGSNVQFKDTYDKIDKTKNE